MSSERFQQQSVVSPRGLRFLAVVSAFALLVLGCTREPSASRAPDVPYEPSPQDVVRAMLDLGQVDSDDLVYDLGCGDGRIVIAAVKQRGARGVCVDIDPQRIRESRENAARAGVADRILFVTQDLFETELKDASVVMLFLWPEVNLRLKPKLRAELRPGSRVVSHWHDMGEWKPDARLDVVADKRERPIFAWVIPAAK
jgi:SAM-dependent methyltransferase